VLFGYEPLFAQAFDDSGRVSKTVVPRADAKLALSALESARKPLGHGFWVFDASDTTNSLRRQTIPLLSPDPSSDFEVASFGPFLVVHTVAPTGCVAHYLKLARRVETLGAQIDTMPDYDLGDADINLGTVLQAERRLDSQKNAPAC
jgi:hypothetical protein